MRSAMSGWAHRGMMLRRCNCPCRMMRSSCVELTRKTGWRRHASSDASAAPLFVGLTTPGKKQDALRGRLRADEVGKVAFGPQVSAKPNQLGLVILLNHRVKLRDPGRLANNSICRS